MRSWNLFNLSPSHVSSGWQTSWISSNQSHQTASPAPITSSRLNQGSWKRVAVMRDSRDVPISVMSFSGSRLEWRCWGWWTCMTWCLRRWGFCLTSTCRRQWWRWRRDCRGVNFIRIKTLFKLLFFLFCHCLYSLMQIRILIDIILGRSHVYSSFICY